MGSERIRRHAAHMHSCGSQHRGAPFVAGVGLSVGIHDPVGAEILGEPVRVEYAPGLTVLLLQPGRT